jgi:hypothetical protein
MLQPRHALTFIDRHHASTTRLNTITRHRSGTAAPQPIPHNAQC